MAGVEILTSSQVASGWAFNWTAFWIVGIVIFAAAAFIGIWQWLNGDCDFTIVQALILIGLGMGGMLGAISGSWLSLPAEYTTEYKVIISDEVSMNEFNEKYEIIEQDGKIYTVRERVKGE